MTTALCLGRLAAALTLLFGALLLSTAADANTLTVQVVDCNGDPMPGATVRIVMTGPMPNPATAASAIATTDADGIAEFGNVGGEYDITVMCGKATKTVHMYINPLLFSRPTLVLQCCVDDLEELDRWDYFSGGTGTAASGQPSDFHGNVKKKFARPFAFVLNVRVIDCTNKPLKPPPLVSLFHVLGPKLTTFIGPRRTADANGYVQYRMVAAAGSYMVSVSCAAGTTTPFVVPAGGSKTVVIKCPGTGCTATPGLNEEQDTLPDGSKYRTTPEGGRQKVDQFPTFGTPVPAPAGSEIVSTPVGFPDGTLHGTVVGPSGQPVPNTSLSVISGTVESQVTTDEKGNFHIPIVGTAGNLVKIAAVGAAAVVVVRIVDKIGDEASTKPPVFVQPGQPVHLTGTYKSVEIQQGGSVTSTPIATATGPKPGQELTTCKTPPQIQPGEVTWKARGQDGAIKEFQSHVFRIEKQVIDERALRSGQHAKFDYDINFGPTMARREVTIGWRVTGPITLRNAGPKRVRLGADGHVSTGGEIRAQPVPPGATEVFTITPVITASGSTKP